MKIIYYQQSFGAHASVPKGSTEVSSRFDKLFEMKPILTLSQEHPSVRHPASSRSTHCPEVESNRQH